MKNRQSVPNAVFGLPGRPINGGSNPRFYDFDDGVTRLVKWHPSRHGEKACYNELVASRLGQLIGSPILRGGPVFVPADIIPPDHKAFGATAGFHFGVARMEGTNFLPASHYKDIDNASELPFAAVFLAWLAVGDQDGHNQFLQQMEVAGKITKRFKLVDMGFMFGTPKWAEANVRNVHLSYGIPSHIAAQLSMAKMKPAIEALKKISDADIRECFDDYPEDWNIPSSDREAAVKRVCEARDNIESIIRNGNASIK
jgi:hypothetical protein